MQERLFDGLSASEARHVLVHPTAKQKPFPPNPERIRLRRGGLKVTFLQRADSLAEGLAQDLVSIDSQNPGILALGDRVHPLRCEISKFPTDKPRIKRAGNLRCSVRATGIQDNQIIRNGSERPQSLGEPEFAVERQHIARKQHHIR